MVLYCISVVVVMVSMSLCMYSYQQTEFPFFSVCVSLVLTAVFLLSYRFSVVYQNSFLFFSFRLYFFFFFDWIVSMSRFFQNWHCVMEYLRVYEWEKQTLNSINWMKTNLHLYSIIDIHPNVTRRNWIKGEFCTHVKQRWSPWNIEFCAVSVLLPTNHFYLSLKGKTPIHSEKNNWIYHHLWKKFVCSLSLSTYFSGIIHSSCQTIHLIYFQLTSTKKKVFNNQLWQIFYLSKLLYCASANNVTEYV